MKKTLLAILALSLAISVNAQPKDSFLMDNLTEPLLKQTKASLKVMNDPEIIAANAKYMRSLYQALIKEGFSKEEALQLVAASVSGNNN